MRNQEELRTAIEKLKKLTAFRQRIDDNTDLYAGAGSALQWVLEEDEDHGASIASFQGLLDFVDALEGKMSMTSVVEAVMKAREEAAGKTALEKANEFDNERASREVQTVSDDNPVEVPA